MHFVYLSLGTNLGNRSENLQKGIKKLQSIGKIIKQSSVLETKAWGKTDQPDFLNQVVLIETKLSPQELLKECQKIETELGRIRVEKWGARTLDIDLLFYDKLILNTLKLKIPHPLLPERLFVLEPLAEIAPDLIHPLLKKNIKTLLQAKKSI